MKCLWNTLRGSNIMKCYKNKPEQPALLAALCSLPRTEVSASVLYELPLKSINSCPTRAAKTRTMLKCLKPHFMELLKADWQKCFARKLQALLALLLQCLKRCCCFSCQCLSFSNFRRSLSVVSLQENFNETYLCFRLTKPHRFFFLSFDF